jgi:cytosine/creatinine deaminase
MTFDLVLRNARIADRDAHPVDIGIRRGRFEAIESGLSNSGGPEDDLNGRLVVPGFVETHIHLDKSCLLGTLQLRERHLGRGDCRSGSRKEGLQ